LEQDQAKHARFRKDPGLIYRLERAPNATLQRTMTTISGRKTMTTISGGKT
jgi:hypothetical protein